MAESLSARAHIRIKAGFMRVRACAQAPLRVVAGVARADFVPVTLFFFVEREPRQNKPRGSRATGAQ